MIQLDAARAAGLEEEQETACEESLQERRLDADTAVKLIVIKKEVTTAGERMSDTLKPGNQ